MARSGQTRRTLLLIAAMTAVLASATPAATGVSPDAPAAVIAVVSSRADLVSGGQALVSVDWPPGASPATVHMLLGDRDVTQRFAVRPDGTYAGLLTGLARGANTLTARAPGLRDAALTITNHPRGGPLFAGAQIQPWVCQAGAVDAQCNAPTVYGFDYMDARSGSLQPYDRNNPPAASAVAPTTTDQGVTVPFIVRTETGYLDRDQYKIAVLYDPERPWAPWAPQSQWNHKVLITHGASCGVDHGAGAAPSVTGDTMGLGSSPTLALSHGFAVMSTAPDNAGHNCNIVTEAESLIMAKEHLVETYGRIRYTIGTGCSGGSLVQQQVANAYPGIYQGILPQCSFPDAWSTSQQLEDYALLRRYLEDPSKWGPGVVWTPKDIAAIEGHPDHANSIELSTLYAPLGDPSAPCVGVTAAQRYNARTNPKGVRCSLQDFMVNVFGKRKEDGFAGSPYDNVGVQYGLNALMSGQLTPAQFVDVNTRIGSHNINYQWRTGREPADRPALANAYRSGAFNETNNMDQVAIIDLRGPDPGAFHDAYRAFTVRARLDREQGHHANHVIWEGFAPIQGDAKYTEQGLLAMDRWLTAVEADHRDVPFAQKIVEDKPADIHDQCSNGVGQTIPSQEACQLVVQIYTTPRVVAGEPLTTDTMKCQLKRLVRSDYYPVEFTDSQWGALTAHFPTGVCDFSKPGVDQQPTVPWQTYEDGPGLGRPIGSPPRQSNG
jgi:Tannase-like family of unknown function (DUF6351)